MSQRGSFVSEYIHCLDCFKAVKSVLLNYTDKKEVCATVVPHWNPEVEGPEMPIVAGKIGAMAHEGIFFGLGILPLLGAVVCHPVRFAVIPEDGHPCVFTAKPVTAKFFQTPEWQDPCAFGHE